MGEAYTPAEVRARSGVSRRQMERWEASGMIVPAETSGEGRGSRRRYDERNLADYCRATAMLAAGYSLAGVRAALATGGGVDVPAGWVAITEEEHARMVEMERAIEAAIHDAWELGGAIRPDTDARLRRALGDE